VSLPEERDLDAIDARLADVQEHLDRVQRVTLRIGALRGLAARYEMGDPVRAEHERAMAEQETDLLIALDALAFHGRVIEAWAAKAWTSIKGEKWKRTAD
jgi:hypothetical protein